MKRINPPEFNESEFEAAVNAFYFHFFLNSSEFELHIPTRRKENRLGYDFTNKKGVPLFFQYKVCNFHTRYSGAQLKKDRDAQGISDNRGFYSFKLHKDIQQSIYLQHNYLFRRRRNNYYVIPAFWRRESYIEFLKETFKFKKRFRKLKYSLYDEIRRVRRLYSPAFPVISDCFFIKPHKEINDADPHHYSINKGHDCMFHSEPVKLTENAFSWNEIIYKIQNMEGKEIDNLPELEKKESTDLVMFLTENKIEIPNQYFENLLAEDGLSREKDESLQSFFERMRVKSANITLHLTQNLLYDYFGITMPILEL